MPSPEITIFPGPAKSIQYTGSNSADILAQAPSIEFVSEEGSVLTLDNLGRTLILSVNTWIIWKPGIVDTLSPTQFSTEWGCAALCDDLATVASDLDTAVTEQFIRAMGIAQVPSLLASGTANVNVQLQPAMPNASYSAYASLFAGISITGLQVNSVTVVDADTVTVQVENTGLITLAGASVMVHAIS